MNIYALVIVCLLSGATNILALEGIETQDIVQALERHGARYGIPGFVYIDNGTQLKALQHSSLSLKDVDAQVQDSMGISIIVSTAKVHSECGRVERRIRTLRESLQKISVSGTHPRTALQWETLFALISNTGDNVPIAKGNSTSLSNVGYDIITLNRLKLGKNNNRSLEGAGFKF